MTLKVREFQTYGKADEHIVVSVVLVLVEFTIKFNAATESHPKAFNKIGGIVS